MAGMLPGVEVARRRRTHPHEQKGTWRDPCPRPRLEPTTAMGEAALRARQRLEEKLGLAGGRATRRGKHQINKDHAAGVKETLDGVVRGEMVRCFELRIKNSEKEVRTIYLDYFRG
eukprot:TRINITY_DN14541_c0_g1_i1.p2 TRINITY_DN14541_c0_g1~~TRINITY_DN14541_c0_g1_i1.p2  ORF type:complete len:116 (-),score=10.09 TRINITY_DN14541_c0_g1_i1:80-427(-)